MSKVKPETDEEYWARLQKLRTNGRVVVASSKTIHSIGQIKREYERKKARESESK